MNGRERRPRRGKDGSLFRRELGWTPFYYLIYVFFVFVQPVLDHAKALEWIVTLVGFAAFLPCYIGVFQRWRPGAIWYAGALAILGMASLPFNSGTACYVIYAGSSLGFILSPAIALRSVGRCWVRSRWNFGC